MRPSAEIILDKDEQIALALACLLAKGHLLIEDLPGLGKTTLAQALARVSSVSPIAASSSRVTCCPRTSSAYPYFAGNPANSNFNPARYLRS